VAFPITDEVHYNEEIGKEEAILSFMTKVNDMCAANENLKVAIYFDGKDNGQDIKAIADMFYRIYTRDSDIYNKVETLIPENRLEQRIVNLAEKQ